MVQATTSHMTPDEFLAWEREQRDELHHYVRGEIFALSGGSARHSYLGAQMIGLLRQGLLGGPCNAFTADLRIGLAADFFVYADALDLTAIKLKLAVDDIYAGALDVRDDA
jgi:Uma2 family endonuclease